MKPQKAQRGKDWFKPKPFPHFTDRIEPQDRNTVAQLVRNNDYVARHAFYPLLFYEVSQRKWKRVGGKISIKKRPISYATHLDTHIYAWHAHLLSDKYNALLIQTEGLSECVTAYRHVKGENGRGKRNIDFAGDVFNEIRRRSDCAILAFDIKSFFPTLDHQLLKKAWAKLYQDDGRGNGLPPAEYNVFRAVTNFAYVQLEDLKTEHGCFDEKHLAQLRREGINAFFRSGEEFRKQVVENPAVKIYKNQQKKDGKLVGIPQGLPISPVLANLYMYEFDLQMVKEVINKFGAFYRRYSDDIIVVCEKPQADFIMFLVKRFIKQIGLNLAHNKTERFLCGEENQQLTIEKVVAPGKKSRNYLNYLGFEFYGDKTLLRGSTLAGYHRKMRKAIGTFVSRARVKAKKNGTNPIVFLRKLYRNYTHLGKKKRRYYVPAYEWEQDKDGTFYPQRTLRKKKHWGNLITYSHDAAEILGENAIRNQVKRHFEIFKNYLQRKMKGV